MSGYGYPKTSRLLTAEEYTAVFNRNQFKVANRYFLILALQQKDCNPRLGTVVAKKNIATAVQRNRIKRIIRESFRHQQGSLANLDLVVLVRKGAEQLQNNEVSNSLLRLWQDLGRKVSIRAAEQTNA